MFAEFPESIVFQAVAIRSFAMLIITAAIAFALKRQSASVLHHVWTLGLVGCLLVPIVSIVSPAWQLAVLPADDVSVQTSSTTSLLRVATAPAINAQAGSEWQHPPRDQSAITASNPTSNVSNDLASFESPLASGDNLPLPSPEPMVASSEPTSRNFAADAILVWLGVAACLVIRFLFQWLQVWRMLRHCKPFHNERLDTVLGDVTQLLQTRRRPTVLSSPQATSPMVAGVFSTRLVLPEQAADWNTDRLRMVLLHESAHVARHDIFTQAIGGLACAVNWFNPLAWYAASQMRKLREIACDDMVVTRCQKPADYADVLLDVARSCRQQVPGMTVAMARSNCVTDRVLAILDTSRNRSALKRWPAWMMASVFVALVGAFSVVQLTAMAQPPVAAPQTQSEETSSQGATKAPDAPAVERMMRVRVVDGDGKPIADASLLANIFDIERTGNFPTKTYQTDQQGEVDVRLPNKLGLLRLWPSKPGYVPQFLNFGNGNQDEIDDLPGSFTFYLQRGERLSGTVVDHSNQPIAGASVQVSVDVSELRILSDSEPIVNKWLASGEAAILTDQDGRWQITNAPPKKDGRDYKFQLQITHPDFAGDSRWGELQEQQGVTTEQLRSGTAKIKLDPGLRIQGKITGPNGEPVTNGLVIWNDQPYWADGINEVAINESGHYRSLPLGPGEYPVTVVAPGYAPQQIKFKLEPPGKDLDFRLKPGNPIELQIVDQAGNPVPDVYVGIGEWRGTEAIYNEQHSNVPDSRIPRKSDSNGIYRWDWAPDDAVVYRFGKNGYVKVEAALVARDKPHRIELPTLMKIFGSVTDKKTGKPIEKFSVVPVQAFRPDLYSTSFKDRTEAEGGKYEIPIDSDGQTGNRYMVRIEADGYRTAFSTKSMEVGDPPLNEDFQLESAAAVTAEVLAADGTPAIDFIVAVGTPTSAPPISMDQPDASFGMAFKVSGESRFELPATFEPQLIRVFNDTGFAEVALAPDQPLGTIQLQPWSSVSGRLMQGDKPIANEGVSFQPLVQRGLTEARFHDSFYSQTDFEGNFHFDRLPPMAGRLQASLGPWRESPMSSSQSVAVDLQPGQTIILTLGSDGNRVIGKVVAKGRDNESLSKQWSINYLVSRDAGMALPAGADPLTIAPDQVVDPSMLQSDDFSTWLGTKRHYFVKLSDEGELQIDGVAPGQYDLVIQLYEQPAGCLVETIGQMILPITVEDGPDAPSVKNLGEIAVECRIGPRVGSDMRTFKFIDSSGRERLVGDMKDRYVLMHVWASWCAPCLASMPNLKATINGYPDKNLTVVGLNVDDVAEQSNAKTLVQNGDWNWAMNYLGSESTMMRQLAVSSVPAYYLIGPDGKLVMSSNQWEEIRQQLDSVLSR